jgi:hypothetical protein
MFGVNADDAETQAAVVAAGYAVAFTRVRMTKELHEPVPLQLPEGIERRAKGSPGG